jgi:riboflavin transporter FmnP
MEKTGVNRKTVMLAKMAMMAAIATIFSLIHFPILPTAPFLEYEAADIPVLISTFAFGPLPGIVIGVVSILLHDMVFAPSNGPYGMIMHIISVAVYVLVAGLIYRKFKTKKGAIIALIAGGLSVVAVMVPANIIITPLFMGVPVDAVYAMLPTAILPFNLIKAAITTVLVFIIYKRISPFLHKW